MKAERNIKEGRLVVHWQDKERGLIKKDYGIISVLRAQEIANEWLDKGVPVQITFDNLSHVTYEAIIVDGEVIVSPKRENRIHYDTIDQS